jgi:hypothetical protein
MASTDQIFEMALYALPERLQAVRARGEPLDRFVFVFFDGAVQPGSGIAVAMLEAENGLPGPEARRQVAALAARARAERKVLAMGALFEPSRIMQLLRENVPGGERAQRTLNRIEPRVLQPIPPDHFRILTVTDSAAKVHIVTVPPATTGP